MITRREPPYTGTQVAPERTKAEIEMMLRKYGAEGIQWTDTRDGGSWRSVLRFLVEVEVQGVRKKIGIEVSPPAVSMRKRMGGRVVNTDATPQAMRILYWWLKSKLEAVSYGMDSAEREFMSHILYSLPGKGGPRTVGDIVEEAIVKGTPLSLLPGQEREERPRLKEG